MTTALAKLEAAGRETQQALAHLERSEREFTLAQTLEDFLAVHRKQDLLAALLKKAGEEQEVQNRAALAKLVTERRLGDLLSAAGDHRGGKSKSHGGTSTPLPEGVTRNHSLRWRQLASVPEPAFRGHVERVCQSEEELTRA